MKKERHKLPAQPKTRRRWLINPRTRVHGGPGYKRTAEKEKRQREIEEAERPNDQK